MPNGRAFIGEPSERSERPERRRGRRVRCNAMLGVRVTNSLPSGPLDAGGKAVEADGPEDQIADDGEGRRPKTIWIVEEAQRSSKVGHERSDRRNSSCQRPAGPDHL